MLLVENQTDTVQPLTESTEDGQKKTYLSGVFMEAETKNRNGRQYQLQEMQREVDRIQSAAAKGQYVLGECDHPCFSREAEVLTDEGWKHFYNLNGLEKVYSLNPYTKNLEESPIHEKFEHDFDGEMIRIKNHSFNTLVTPNHKFMVYHSTTGKHKFITAREIYDQVNSNEKGIGKWYIPRRTAGITGVKNYKTFALRGCGRENLGRGQNPDFADDVEVDFNSFCSFMGLYLSEGCTHKKQNTYKTCIYQKEGDNADYIRDVLKSLPFKYNEYFVDRGEYGVHVKWEINDRRVGEYLKPLGVNYQKYIPKDILSKLDKESSEILVDSFLVGDGRGKPHTTGKYCDVFSTSYQLIEDLGQACVLAGYSVRFYTEVCENDYTFAGRTIKAENKRPLYFAKILTSKGVYLEPRNLKVSKEEFKDKVYCISANNENFIARDGNYTFVSGNSTLEISLKNVSHKITEMKMQGNQAIGKAEILESTQAGAVLKGLVDSGVQVGVSSRGKGSVNQKGIVENFELVTIDAVAVPSAHNAYPTSIMESLEMYKRQGIITDLAEAVMHDDQAQKYFQKEIQKFIQSLKL